VQVVQDDPEVVEGDVGELRAAWCAAVTRRARRVYELTAESRAQADESCLRDLAADSSGHQELRTEVQRLHSAARQVGAAGSPDQVEQAVAIVRSARQSLYRLLAEQ
jgi:hypothetical protein